MFYENSYNNKAWTSDYLRGMSTPVSLAEALIITTSIHVYLLFVICHLLVVISIYLYIMIIVMMMIIIIIIICQCLLLFFHPGLPRRGPEARRGGAAPEVLYYT